MLKYVLLVNVVKLSPLYSTQVFPVKNENEGTTCETYFCNGWAGRDVYPTLVRECHPALKRSARVRVLDTAQHTGDEAVATPRTEGDVDPAMKGGADLRGSDKEEPCTIKGSTNEI